jgi:CubicO group peptidase (beta-lactamase class C family)
LGAVAAVLATALAPAPAAAQFDPLDGLDHFILSGMEDWGVPGLAIAVVRNDSVVYLEGFGTRRLGKDAPVTPHTLFAVSSCTKAVTATALALLVQQGKLDWDDPVSRYLPSFALYDPWVTRHLTVRDLLSHRTGYAGWAADHLWQGSTLTPEEILHRFRYQQPVHGFRSAYGYSNIMYIAAGQLFPAIVGEDWASFVTHRLLEPLGMEESTLSITALEKPPDVAVPHIAIEGAVKPVARYDPWNAAPAMGMNTSATDMATWLRFNLANGVFEGDTLVQPKVMAALWQPQIWWEGPGDAGLEERRFSAYGLGWDVFDYQGRTVLRHSGSIDGMVSLVTMVPEENLGIVVMTNLVPSEFPTVVTNHVMDRVAGLPTHDWNELFLERRDEDLSKLRQEEWYWEKARDKKAKRTLPLDAYVGEYHDSLSGWARVTRENGGLVFHYNDKYVADLTHWQHDVYMVRWRDPYVRLWAGRTLLFVPDGKGRIGALKVAFDNEIEFTKAAHP